MPRDLATLAHDYITPLRECDIDAMAVLQRYHYITDISMAGHWELATATAYWANVLNGACCGGNALLAVFALDHDAHIPSMMLESSCASGHLGLINLAIANGASRWNWGLHGACRGNHPAIADLMVRLGATCVCHTCGKSADAHLLQPTN